MFDTTPKTVEQADLMLSQLHRQMAEQEERKATATAELAILTEQWAALCLTADLDGASNAKEIAANEKLQGQEERTVTRADNALVQLQERIRAVKAQKEGLIQKERIELLQHLTEQDHVIVADAKAAIVALAEAMAAYHKHGQEKNELHNQVKRYAYEHGTSPHVPGFAHLEGVNVPEWAFQKGARMDQLLQVLGLPDDEPQETHTQAMVRLYGPSPTVAAPVVEEPAEEPDPNRPEMTYHDLLNRMGGAVAAQRNIAVAALEKVKGRL